MRDIWDDLGDWVDKLGEATCAAIDDVGGKALGWLDEALAGRTPEELGEVLLEFDQVPLLGAWMREGRERRSEAAREGDVIGVQRLGFAHYGIYASDEEVIHLRAPEGELGGDARVVSTTLAEFMRDAEAYFVVDVGERGRTTQEFVDGVEREVEVFPRSVVVARARARLGERGYHLLGWNCEHFAMWCKTGEASSAQVADVATGLGTLLTWLDRRSSEPHEVSHDLDPGRL